MRLKSILKKIKQYQALFKLDNVDLKFEDDAVTAIALADQLALRYGTDWLMP
mgnify:CR=1 FL=1